MTKISNQDEEVTREFMLAEFQAAQSRRQMHTTSTENLLNIHLTIISFSLGGLITLWSQNQTTITITITILSLFILTIIGVSIERRISVHDANNRWDGYRYRLAEQYFLDQYPDSKIKDYTNWPDRPEKRLTISRGSFARSVVGIIALINTLIFSGLVFFLVLQMILMFFLNSVIITILVSSVICLLASFIGWQVQKWYYHQGAKRQGMRLELSRDPPIKKIAK